GETNPTETEASEEPTETPSSKKSETVASEDTVQRPRLPLDDAEWQASLHRCSGTARRRIAAYAATLVGAPAGLPDVCLRLRLPVEVVPAFTSSLEAARSGLTQ